MIISNIKKKRAAPAKATRYAAWLVTAKQAPKVADWTSKESKDKSND